MRNSEDLHADGPTDDTPVEVELRQMHVGVWEAIAKDPPITAVEIDADAALDAIKRKLDVHYGRTSVKVVHRDKPKIGPAASR